MARYRTNIKVFYQIAKPNGTSGKRLLFKF